MTFDLALSLFILSFISSNPSVPGILYCFLQLDVTSFLTPIKLSSCEVMKVSTRKLGGIGGNSSLFSACSMTKWYMALYFQKVLSWPDEFGGQIGQCTGTFVHGELFVGFMAFV